MKVPEPGDFIDIHTHEAKPVKGIFALDVCMVHEERAPVDIPGIVCSAGIHPWFLTEANKTVLLDRLNEFLTYPSIVAVGEAGFDKIKGPSLEIQRIVFEKQVELSESKEMPLVIHCVRAWDELLMEHKKLKPHMPWLVHGFRGSKDLAVQLINKGMYISFWFDFIVRPESSDLVRNLPYDRIFLETDGADADIRDIYNKVSVDLSLEIEALKKQIRANYFTFFNLNDN